jgi:DNA polymerase elongation subunit (family B)
MLDLSTLSNDQLLQYQQQLEYDISKYNNTQLAKKVQLNSAYGVCGNQFFRWYDIRLAEAVTKSGQLVIRWLESYINEYFNKTLKTNTDYVIASDTDSLIVTLEKLVDKCIPIDKQQNVDKVIDFMNKVCEDVLQPVINTSCNDLAEYLSVKAQTIVMKREILADRVIWVTKKRYVMSVRDNEDVRLKDPELKIMGIEAIRTSTPTICREKIKQALKIILHGTEMELQTFVEDFEKIFNTFKIEDIAFPRTVNGLKKYHCDINTFIKGTPIHVRGSLLYNSCLKIKNVSKKYETIKEGEKIKFIYLKEPNMIQDTVIAFPDILPKEFELNAFIDYKTQFEKTFVEPLSLILNIVGWKPRTEKNLSAFFN